MPWLRAYGKELTSTGPARIVISGFAAATFLALIFASKHWLWWLFLLALFAVFVQAWHSYRSYRSRPTLVVVSEVTRPVQIANSQTGASFGAGRFVRLKLTNEEGTEARNLHCEIEFTALDGQPLFDEVFQARWANKEQLADAFSRAGPDITEVDLAPNGRVEPIDLLVKFAGNPQMADGCYVWNNDSMLAGVKTDRYRIDAGEFDLRATIRGADGVKAESNWRIHATPTPQIERLRAPD